MSSTPAPGPWEARPRRSRDLARLLRAMLSHRDRLLTWYPNVQVPSAGPAAVMPVAALLRIWERWDYTGGQCPRCGSPALATCFGGISSIGSVGGHCTGCGVMVTRSIGGFSRVMEGCRRALDGTPYKVPIRNYPGGWAMQGEPAALLAVLEELGAEDLPDPRSRAFRR